MTDFMHRYDFKATIQWMDQTALLYDNLLINNTNEFWNYNGKLLTILYLYIK